MATCKDCVHYDVCLKYISLIAEEKIHKPLFPTENAETTCEHFKDKSGDVETLPNGHIALPCYPGDDIWLISSIDNEITHCTVFTISMLLSEKSRFSTLTIKNYRGAILSDFNLSDIGKTLFLTQEEAEQALTNKNQPDNTPQ